MILFPFISLLIFCAAIARCGEKQKGTVALVAVIFHGMVSSLVSLWVMSGHSYHETIRCGNVFGDVVFQADRLSAWFILLTNFTFITGILYGRQYLKKYAGQPANLSLHYISFVLNQAAITGIYLVQHMLAFLCTWEIMALSAFLLVIFENGKIRILKAGINYLIQSHISIVLLTLGFIWVYTATGSFDFTAISRYASGISGAAAVFLFLAFFTGFAIKAGFVPFHTWLPHAHPAAPSHISGVMSGVIIKTGIYGILRMLLLVQPNYLAVGYGILIFSVVTGIYGVMLALVQHNIKRLLAYHSIENIGIIGMGIGIGCIGKGLNFPLMAFAGFGGALLHTLNHSLFKSLLFYNAGSLYQATGTTNIERLGGLIHTMPKTALLFLLASLAICGLPPFNGFISEFLVYSGLYNAFGTNSSSTILIVLSIAGLALIGGLAMFCFTKAFGIMFLGNERHRPSPHGPLRTLGTLGTIGTRGLPGAQPSPVSLEVSKAALFPSYLIAFLIIFIGIAPGLFFRLMNGILLEYTGLQPFNSINDLAGVMRNVTMAAWGIILLSLLIYLIRARVTAGKKIAAGPTWGCGYTGETRDLQYTASSFVRSYSKLITPLLITSKVKNEIQSIVPEVIQTETHFHDKLENGLVDAPVKGLRRFLNCFRFLQNGSVQFYVLYGVVFIGISIAIPLLFNFIKFLVTLIKQL